MISSTYETPDKVKSNLERAGVDVRQHILDGTLMIVDSLRSYHLPEVNGLLKLLMSLNERISREGKKGILCFGDVGIFFLLEKIEELISYEFLIPRQLQLTSRSFCCYHKAHFDVLTKKQKEKLQQCHLRIL